MYIYENENVLVIVADLTLVRADGWMRGRSTNGLSWSGCSHVSLSDRVQRQK